MEIENKDLELEMNTMKLMIYSLKIAIDNIVNSLSTEHEEVSIEEWENECRNLAKKLLEEEKNEI